VLALRLGRYPLSRVQRTNGRIRQQTVDTSGWLGPCLTNSLLGDKYMNRPKWYTDEHDSAWDRVSAAFANDWEQTKRDFGSKNARELGQDVDDTVKQVATGSDGAENHEQALRFGYAAQQHYKGEHPTWNDNLDAQLRTDYGADYDRERAYIRRAYEYRDPGTGQTR
jgi:hypothetical protein